MCSTPDPFPFFFSFLSTDHRRTHPAHNKDPIKTTIYLPSPRRSAFPRRRTTISRRTAPTSLHSSPSPRSKPASWIRPRTSSLSPRRPRDRPLPPPRLLPISKPSMTTPPPSPPSRAVVAAASAAAGRTFSPARVCRNHRPRLSCPGRPGRGRRGGTSPCRLRLRLWLPSSRPCPILPTSSCILPSRRPWPCWCLFSPSLFFLALLVVCRLCCLLCFLCLAPRSWLVWCG